MRSQFCRLDKLIWGFVICLITWLIWVTFLNTSSYSHNVGRMLLPVIGRMSSHTVRHTICSPVDTVPGIPEGSLYGRPVPEAKTIMFNSVPKCGSRTLVWVFWDFVRQFATPDPVYVEYMLSIREYEKSISKIREQLAEQTRPGFIHGHYRYAELPENERPVFASMIREPLSRYISWYYFMRHGDADMNKTQLLKNLGPHAARPNETLDECFHNNRADCKEPFYYELNVRLFCGYDPQCDKNPQYALNKAKENLEKYMVIGLMEEYEDTLKVMEKLMPSMCGGAVKTYRDMLGQSAQNSKTTFKKKPSKEIETYLKEKLKYDIEFYEYVKDRFHKLKDQLGIGSTPDC
ncbi:uronyl 2-sulfotransferase-like isoform X1 [Apostichopus japonicus]|uniref:uronyl 2-sulfotransferase-like isoform X1 n=1 Tax=Stichopus japonicus TaxID=307972 RepID=UPI003AB8208A